MILVFGSLSIGCNGRAIGRKKTIMVFCLPLLVGWIIVGISEGNFLLLCLGRIFQGIGTMSSVTQVYLVEVADAQRRGMFGGSGALSVSAGITLVFVFGAILPNWRWVCIGCGIIPVLVFSLMPFLPETPNYLVMTGNREEAYKALSWLRGEQHDIEGEIKALEKSLSPPSDTPGDVNQKDSAFHQLKRPSAFKPFLLLIAIFILMQSTGTYAVIFYAVNVLQDLGIGNAYVASISIGVVRIIGTLFGTMLLKKFKRTVLMTGSAIAMAFALSALALTVYFKDDIESRPPRTILEEGLKFVLPVLPLFFIILYILFFGLGVGTVPWLLMGELCPVKVKGITSGCVACSAFGTIFILVKLFPTLTEALGQHGTYFGFAIVCVIMAFFTQTFVPGLQAKIFKPYFAKYIS